jgi:hypothetical protein
VAVGDFNLNAKARPPPDGRKILFYFQPVVKGGAPILIRAKRRIRGPALSMVEIRAIQRRQGGQVPSISPTRF